MAIVSEREGEAVSKLVWARLRAVQPKLATNIARRMYSPPFAALSARDKLLAKMYLLNLQHAAIFNALVESVCKKPERQSLTGSSLASFLSNMPFLAGDPRFNYKEMIGGNYKNL